jgi:adenosylhomocysteine nucleosidase
VRTVSDTADADAPESFLEFLHALGGTYSSGILRRFLAAWAFPGDVNIPS